MDGALVTSGYESHHMRKTSNLKFCVEGRAPLGTVVCGRQHATHRLYELCSTRSPEGPGLRTLLYAVKPLAVEI